MSASKQIKQYRDKIKWQDLTTLKPYQVAYNLILPYPFLLLSWWFASQGDYIYYLLACTASYLFFASAFRQAHDAFHRTLGVSRTACRLVMPILSLLMLTSMHATRATHMAHHRNPLSDDDLEGSLGKLTFYDALSQTVSIRFALYRRGIELSGPSDKRWIALETFLILGFIVVAFASGSAVLVYHVLVMLLANAVVGVVAFWSVHHDTELTDGSHAVARTERNVSINGLTFNLLFHVEHHLYPAVPSNHLPELARRLDAAAPKLTQLRVVPTIIFYYDIKMSLWKNYKKLINNRSQ